MENEVFLLRFLQKTCSNYYTFFWRNLKRKTSFLAQSSPLSLVPLKNKKHLNCTYLLDMVVYCMGIR